MSDAVQKVIPLRILPPEPVCEDQKELIALVRDVLKLAQEGSMHSVAFVYTRNDDTEVTTRWMSLDGALNDIIAAVGKLNLDLLSSGD